MKEILKNMFLRNMGMELLSIVMAILAWCTIMNLSDPKVTVKIKNISVNKINEQAVVDENMIYEVVSGDTIEISVTGPRSLVQSLKESDINAYVNLKELSITNSCPIHVSITDENVSKSVEITSKSDEVMILSLEQMISDNKQIAVELKGSPAANYYASYSVSPLMLEVYGSSTQVNNIERLVAAVDIEGKSESFTADVEVVPYDKDGNILDSSKFTMRDKKATVSVELYPTKNINVVIDAKVSARYGFACQPLGQAPSSVTIAGPQNVIRDITEIVIPFEREDLIETVAENISLADYIPEQCYLVSDTDTVSVTIPVVRLSENRVMSVNMSDISFRNMPAGLSVINKTAKVNISIWGAEGTTGEIMISDLGLYADCSSITAPGTYQLPLKYNTGEQLQIDNLTISVTVGNG